jgi:hypothetical protein
MRIKPNERMPMWWGIAYYDFPMDETVCYPIPINWLVAWLRYVYAIIARPTLPLARDNWLKKVDDAYVRGMEDGRQAMLTEQFFMLTAKIQNGGDRHGPDRDLNGTS